MKRFFKSAQIEELDDLSDVAEERIYRLRDMVRANIIPPLFRTLRTFTPADLKADARSGLLIAAITIPQAVAFSLLIGIPAPAVIGSAIVGAILCSLYCSSRHLVFGPTNTISIILTGALLSLAHEPLAPLQKVLVIGFLMGVLQLIAGFADLGKITQFISRSVIVGYSTAVGILIATGQLGNLFGIARGNEVNLPGTLKHLASSFITFQFHPETAIVGLGGLLILIWLRRWRPLWPEGLVLLTLAGLASWSLGLQGDGVRVIGDLGDISGAVPLFTGFPLNADGLALLPKVMSVALAAAILGMLEAVTIAKSLATKTGERINPNQELIGMGLGNLVGAGFGAMPGSASFLRSAAGLHAGGRTQWAVIIGSIVVLLLVLLLSPLLSYIPIAAIAAYLIVIAIRLFQPEQIFTVRRATRGDALVFWLTLSAALFLQLDTAIYTGIGLSLVLFLQKASAPTLLEHAFDTGGQLSQITAPARRNHAQVSIIHVEGDLFFGAADLFQDGVRRLAEDPDIKVFILRLKNARHLDATTVMALVQLLEYLRSENRHLLISGIHGEVAAVMKRSGFVEKIGSDNLFPSEENATLATKKALQRAQTLIGVKPELRIFFPEKANA